MKIKLNYARHLWLSLLLLVGVAAIAVPGLNGTNSGNVAKVGDTEYATIEEAVAAWGPGKTLTLLADVTTTSPVEVMVNPTVSTQGWTLNLGNFTWTASGCNAFNLKAAGGTPIHQSYGFKINANQSGGITAQGKYAIQYSDDGKCTDSRGYRPRLELNGGTYNASSIVYYSTYAFSSTKNGASVFMNKSADGTEPVFNGNFGLSKCSVTVNAGYFNGTQFTVYRVSSTVEPNIFGGHFKTYSAFPTPGNDKGLTFGNYKVFARSDASIDMTNGAPATYEAKATKALLLSTNQSVNYSDYIYYEKADDAINKYSSGNIDIVLSEGINATQNKSFSSGTLTIDATAVNSEYTGTITLSGNNAKFVIKFPEGEGHYGVNVSSGGTLHVEETVADGIVTRTYSRIGTVSNPEAQVGSNNFSTVYDAFYAVDGTTTNQTITLLKDVTNAGIVTNGTAASNDGKTVATFDLNGKSIGIGSVAAGNNADYTLTIIDSSQDKTGTVTNSDASLFILALTGINDYSGSYTLKIQAGTWQFDPSNVVINGETHNLVDEGYVAKDNGDGTWTVGEVDYVAAIGDKKYTTLQSAFDAAKDGDVVTLLKDYDATEEYPFTAPNGNKARNLGILNSITFDGANHTLTVKGNGIWVGGGSSVADVTIKDVTISNAQNAGRCVDTRGKIGTLTLDNATLSTEGQEASQPLTIGGDQADAATVKILNGSTVATSEDGKYGYAITTFNPVNMTIDGSTIKGWACLNIKAASSSAGSNGSIFTITKSELTSKNVYPGESNAYSVFKIEDVDVTVNVTNTTINVDGDSNTEAIVAFAPNNTNGSIVNLGEGNNVTFTGTTDFALNDNAASKLIISGGIFNQPVPEQNCAEGMIPADLGDGKYSVKVGAYVAQIEGGAKYETLADAFTAAADGNTVTLLKDVALTDRLFVNAGAAPAFAGSNNRYATTSENKSITLDLSGYNVTTSSNIALAGGSLNIVNSGTADAEHGVISTSGSGLAPIEIRGTGDLASKRTLKIGENVTLKGVDYGLNVFGSNDAQKNVIEVTVNGTVDGVLFVLGNLSNAENDIVINANGKVASTTDAGIALNGNAKVNVAEGAEITGLSGIEVRAGELTVNGGAITATASEYSYAPNGSGTTVKGAAIAVSQHGTLLPTTANVNGGTLTGTKTIAVVAHEQNTSLENVTVVAKDEFVANNTEIPAGFKWVSSEGMSTLTPCDYVAQVGETKYETLADAFAAAADGNTITLLKDVSLTERLFVNAGAAPAYAGSNNRYATTSENKSITLDLNGYNVTSSNNIALAGGSLNIVNNGTAAADHGVISTSDNGLAPVEIRGTGDLASKRTLTVGENVTLKGAKYGLNIFGSNDAQKNDIEVNVNGKVEGTLFVLGNLKNTANDVVINVNSGASLKGKEGIALNGFATVNVADNTTIEGTELGIEVRAGNLNVAGGTITSAATEYTVKSNGDGSAAKGAAISVAQHTTGLPISTYITGCTLTGVKTISVADPENGNLAGVTVKVADALANAKTVIIPAAYKWVSDGTMSTLTPRDPVAKIDETVYYSLASAIAAVPTDGTETTITLLTDVTENAVVKDGKKIVLDLGEKTLTGYIVQYDGELNVKNGTLAGTVYVNGGPASAEAGYNKFTLAADAAITSDWGFILYQGPNGNDAYGSVIDINGTVNGTAWVMGNITEGNSVINVNSGAKIEGSVFGLNGLATLNVKEDATIIGSETGIEVRAGNLNVEGGTITSTATKYIVNPNGSGTTTTGAAIAIAQHTTGLPINANITGGTLSGPKTISVADPQSLNYTGVVVTAKDELTEKENNVIPEGYIWMSNNNNGTSTLTKIEDGEYKLIDTDTRYPFMSLKSDISVSKVTYERTFTSELVDQHQAWYVPMDYTITADDAENFTFYKLQMIAGAAEAGEADPNKMYLYVTPMNVGETLVGNRPYTVKPKAAKENYIFTATSTTLYAPNKASRLNVTTSTHSYDFFGQYEKTTYTGKVGDFYVLSGNALHPNDATIKLRPYRWNIKVSKNNINDGYSKIEFVIVEDGDATGINSVRGFNADDVEGIYTINGMKLDEPVKGINIIKYKNGRTEKRIIK